MKDHSSPRRELLVIRLGGLGNIIFALPLLENLKRHFAPARLTLLTQESFLPLVKLGAADEGLSMVRLSSGQTLGQWTSWPNHYWRILNHLRRQKYDMVIDLQSFFETTLLAGLSGAKLRLGRIRHQWQSFFLDDFQKARPRRRGEHQVDEFLRFIPHVFGCPPVAQDPQLQPPPSLTKEIYQKLTSQLGPRPWIGINLGASIPEKRLPLEKIFALGDFCQKEGWAPLYILGPQERDLRHQVRQKVRHQPRALLVETDLYHLAGHLALLDVLVGADTGPLHMAAALSTPVLAFFRQGYVERYGPCVCPHKTLITSRIQDLSVDEITTALSNLLRRASQKKRKKT